MQVGKYSIIMYERVPIFIFIYLSKEFNYHTYIHLCNWQISQYLKKLNGSLALYKSHETARRRSSKTWSTSSKASSTWRWTSTHLGWKVLYLLYSILRLRLLRIGAAVPNLERVVLPLIIRLKGGGYYTRAALIRVRNLLQRIR